MRSLQATPPFVKGGRGDLKLGEVRTTPSRGRGKISPHPSLSKRGVQATWQIRIGEVHPRSYPATSSFSRTFATDPNSPREQSKGRDCGCGGLSVSSGQCGLKNKSVPFSSTLFLYPNFQKNPLAREWKKGTDRPTSC